MTGPAESTSQPATFSRSTWVAAGLLAALLGLAAGLSAWRPSLYYTLSQEDGFVEWATVWAFLLAALGHARVARAHRGLARTYGFLLGLFCFAVAMEEISWGQRLFGFQPPSYFLEHNAQQELNWHNQVEDATRKLLLQGVILAYGVGLALLPRMRGGWALVKPLADRLGVVPPAAPLAIGFLAASLVYGAYPFRFAGEWVELTLGMGLLLGVWGGFGAALRVLAVAVLLGVLTPPGLAALRPSDPLAEQHARDELAALHADWRQGRLRTECGVHRRLFHLVEEEGFDELRDGVFTALPHLPAERGRFFLDPWEQPYWVMDRCHDDGTRRIRVYSFGANRRRDSTHEEVRDDDVVETILEWVAPTDE